MRRASHWPQGASQRARRLYKAAAVAQRLHTRLPAPARQALGTSPLIRSARPSAPAMASIQQLVGRWRLVESKGFDEYMKEVGEVRRHAARQRGTCDSVPRRPLGVLGSGARQAQCLPSIPLAPSTSHAHHAGERRGGRLPFVPGPWGPSAS